MFRRYREHRNVIAGIKWKCVLNAGRYVRSLYNKRESIYGN